MKDVEGTWHQVPLCTGSMIVNIGDMLEEMTKGEYKATTHRVQQASHLPLCILGHFDASYKFEFLRRFSFGKH